MYTINQIMKPTTKSKVVMAIALLTNEFNAKKKQGEYRECVGIDKAIEIIKDVFKADLKEK